MRREVLRYLAVGVANTTVGLSVIWALMLLGVPPLPANAVGYAVGLTLAFFLNRSWTFRADPRTGQALRYLAAFLVAYLLNAGILAAETMLLGVDGYLAQVPAMATYTVSFFLLNKYFVFTDGWSRS